VLVAAVLGLAALIAMPASAVGPSTPIGPGGPSLVLTGADLAYAWFDADIDGCTADVFVSYGVIDMVRYSGGVVEKPQSDVYLHLNGCGYNNYDGVEPALGASNVEMVSLESASLNEFVIDDGQTGMNAVVTIDWEAEGPWYIEVFNDEYGRATHKTKDAEVSNFSITVDGEPLQLTLSGEELPVLTHYNEVVY